MFQSPNNLSAYKISSILFPRNGLQDLERIVHENGAIREKEPFFLSGTNYNEASITIYEHQSNFY